MCCSLAGVHQWVRRCLAGSSIGKYTNQHFSQAVSIVRVESIEVW